MNIISGKILDTLLPLLREAKNEIVIISPFMKVDVLGHLIEEISQSVKIIVVSGWRIDSLLFGSVDLGIYPLLKDRSVPLLVNNDIHLKCILIDRRLLFLGSSNVTQMGYCINKVGNIEANNLIEVDREDSEFIFKVVNDSLLMDDYYFKDTKKILDSKDALVDPYMEAKKSLLTFDKLLGHQYGAKILKQIFVSDFPFTVDPRELMKPNMNIEGVKHDVKLFGLKTTKNSLEDITSSFINSRAYAWQNSIVRGSILFGAYSEKLHSALLDSPKPYRKDVKELVANMFNWSIILTSKYTELKHSHTSSLIKG